MTKDVDAGWVSSWLQQILLQRAPQDDPFSYPALVWSLLAYVLVDLFQARTASGWTVSIGMSVMDTLIVVLFSWLVLTLANKPARLAQTLTALAGTGTLLGLLAMPMMLHASRVRPSGEPTAALVMGWLVLLVWTITVQAHIFRHALSSRYGVGLMVAGLHVVITIMLLNYFFPQATD